MHPATRSSENHSGIPLETELFYLSIPDFLVADEIIFVVESGRLPLNHNLIKFMVVSAAVL